MDITVKIRKGIKDIAAQLRIDGNRAECLYHGKTVVSFDLAITNDGAAFGRVEETQGYYLLSVKINHLATLPSDTASFALPTNGGRLVRARDLPEGEYSFQLDSKNPLHLICLYNDSIMYLLESDSCENRLYYESAHGAAAVSYEFIYRLAEFELAEYGHNVAAITPDYYLKVQDDCHFTLKLMQGDWRDAARLLQTRYHGRVNPYYADKIVGKILADNGSGKQRITFDEIGGMIKRFAALMNFQPAVLYLVGWQFNGHDTGYPAIDTVNKSLGGKQKLDKLIKLGLELNITISFHDNYDDAYKNSPDWREDMVSLDAGGGLMKCGLFVQGQAYLLSNYKYGELAVKRVQRTLQLYQIKDSYHIDVLSGAFKAGRRYDFNPKSPASARKNLAGKLRVVDEFAKHGVDVTTEDFTCLMLGRISHFWHMAFDDKTEPHETAIPFLPFICHSIASWGSHGERDSDVCRAILNGACFSEDLHDENFDTCIGMYYLVTLPWIQLYGKKICDYQRVGNVQRVIYQNAVVEVDMVAETYRVTLDGEVIAENYSTFVEQKHGVYLAYSRFGTQYRRKLRLCGSDICVEKLLPDGSSDKIEHSYHDGWLVFDAEAGSPYRIQRYDINTQV